MNEDKVKLFWKAKLVAWMHDPPAKGLLLGRDPAGHEASVRELFGSVFGAPEFPADVKDFVKKGDHWASAADRPQAPKISHSEFAASTFSRKPVFSHPVDGSQYPLQSLAETDPEALKTDGVERIRELLALAKDPSGNLDLKKAFLAVWRFGPENPEGDLGLLWNLLPADTRIPDHSIWEHLRISSAFAGCFALEEEPALLSVSFGPVQSFIAKTRSTSDLWAGSHFLSLLSWEGMKAVVEEFGPDSILLPDLWSVPIVDVWLHSEGISFPPNIDWKRKESDSNPLFAAALPNAFTALVPAGAVKKIASKIENRVREWTRGRAGLALKRILEEAGMEPSAGGYAREQLDRQMAGFPEVHWSAVPWTLVARGPDDKAKPEQPELHELLGFFQTEGGFLGSKLQKLLCREIELDGATFYRPNPGVLYPALFELVQRARDAAKSVRPFEQTCEEGFRCTLCGENEWLSIDRDHLSIPRGSRGTTAGMTETLWTRVAARRSSWTRKDDHLCALCTLKRVWPSLFRDEIKKEVEDLEEVQRYVVSTHTMALAPSLMRMLETWNPMDHEKNEDIRKLGSEIVASGASPVALPRRLHDLLRRKASADPRLTDFVRRVPDLLDMASESEGDSATRSRIEKRLENLIGQPIEDYYALLLMDGDRMGALISGASEFMPAYRELWHPGFRDRVEAAAPAGSPLREYLTSKRAVSPSLHATMSRSLNSFALQAAPFIVEELFTGKVLYAGGDDLMAMSSVDQVLEILLTVRAAYSGHSPAQNHEELARICEIDRRGFRIASGHMTLKDRLYRMMGQNARASAGIVIAHHTAPLGAVLRELRSAESRAKNQGGRNAFSIHLLKRSGGAARFTARFWPPDMKAKMSLEKTPLVLLMRLRRALEKDLSRRAAYHILSWIDGVPLRFPEMNQPLLDDESLGELMRCNLLHQMKRQLSAEQRADATAKQAALERLERLSRDLVSAAMDRELAGSQLEPREFIREAVTVAEFLAREGRSAGGGK